MSSSTPAPAPAAAAARRWVSVDETFTKSNPFYKGNKFGKLNRKQTFKQVTVNDPAKQESTRPLTTVQMAAFAYCFKPDATTPIDVLYYYEYCCHLTNVAVAPGCKELFKKALADHERLNPGKSVTAMMSQEGVYSLGLTVKGNEELLVRIKTKAGELGLLQYIDESIQVQLAIHDLIMNETSTSTNAELAASKPRTLSNITRN